jgi:hypothetical protein
MNISGSVEVAVVNLFLADKASVLPFDEREVARALSEEIRKVMPNVYVRSPAEARVSRFVVVVSGNPYMQRVSTFEELMKMLPADVFATIASLNGMYMKLKGGDEK